MTHERIVFPNINLLTGTLPGVRCKGDATDLHDASGVKPVKFSRVHTTSTAMFNRVDHETSEMQAIKVDKTLG